MRREEINFRPVPFFFLNSTEPDAVSLTSAREAMRKLRECGYGGAILFNKPPAGFSQEAFLSPQWFAALENFCIAAREEKLDIWINDGWNFPPGDAGGRILKAAPHLKQYRLARNAENKIVPVEVSWGFPAFEEPENHRLFLAFTYDETFRYLGKYFGDPIKGIFSDADNRRMIPGSEKAFPERLYFPWAKDFSARFQKRFGYRIEPYFEDIFAGADTQQIEDYWQFCGELYHSWFAANHQWCREHGIRYSFHTSDTGPQDPVKCKRCSAFSEGDFFALAENSDVPGTDHELAVMDGGTHFDTRYVVPKVTRGGDTSGYLHPRFADTLYDLRAKYTSSAAFLHHRDRALCEAFAATNWGATPEVLRRIAAWQIMQGINFFVPHAVHLRFFGETKFFAPPEFLHAFPPDALRLFNGFLEKYSRIASFGEFRPQLAVLDPTVQLWRNHDAENFFRLCDKLNRMAVDYVITDRKHASEFPVVLDALSIENPAIPAEYASFTGGTLSYRRRFLPDGSAFLLAANLWSDRPLSGELSFNGKTYALELYPGEIAVLGGPYEEYRSPEKRIPRETLTMPCKVTWETPQRIAFRKSFCWENTAELPGMTLLCPPGIVPQIDAKIVPGKAVKVFDEPYQEYALPSGEGRHCADFAAAEFSSPVYLQAEADVEYHSSGDFAHREYDYYSLSIYAPESEELKLSPRRHLLHAGSWAEQGQCFYSGMAEYAFETAFAYENAELECRWAGCCCRVFAGTDLKGVNVFPPCRFPLGKLAKGETIRIQVTNTLSNLFDGCRAPGGLLEKPVIAELEK